MTLSTSNTLSLPVGSTNWTGVYPGISTRFGVVEFQTLGLEVLIFPNSVGIPGQVPVAQRCNTFKLGVGEGIIIM